MEFSKKEFWVSKFVLVRDFSSAKKFDSFLMQTSKLSGLVWDLGGFLGLNLSGFFYFFVFYALIFPRLGNCKIAFD